MTDEIVNQLLLEIATQLKRIADKLDAWTLEDALATYECNGNMRPK